jgi:hypothetical protein
VGTKTFEQITDEFAEFIIPRVWEREGRKVSRVATRLSMSQKNVRRILIRAGRRKPRKNWPRTHGFFPCCSSPEAPRRRSRARFICTHGLPQGSASFGAEGTGLRRVSFTVLSFAFNTCMRRG